MDQRGEVIRLDGEIKVRKLEGGVYRIWDLKVVRRLYIGEYLNVDFTTSKSTLFNDLHTVYI